MPTAIAGDNVYPSLEDVSSLVRSLINDDGPGATDTVGEGQIAVDNPLLSPAMQRLMSASIAETYRELRSVGDATLIADNYIVAGLPPIHGPYGIGAPAPETQVALTYNGFFDGTTMWPNLKLPSNMLMPLRMWERATGSELPFQPMVQSQDGLPPGIQGPRLHLWEWRSDGIWMPGSTMQRDIRLRSQTKLPLYFGPNIDWSTTYIPIMDCVSAVAYKTAAKYAMRLQGATPNWEALDNQAKFEIGELQNEQVRRAQRVPYRRVPYGGGDRR